MEKNSQSFQLKKIIKQSVAAVIVGAVLLLLSIGTNLLMSRVTDEELEKNVINSCSNFGWVPRH